ncbi:MAG: hypothetical protein AAB373_06435 [Patescibacteria group bacterium]
MNIKKILKFYLVLTLILSGASFVNSNDYLHNHVSGYMATVFNAFGELDASNSEEEEVENIENKVIKTAYSAVPEFTFVNETLTSSIANLFDFKIENNPANAYASPGAKQVTLMDFNFKTKNSDLTIGKIKFKTFGLKEGELENAYIYAKDKLISTASIDQEYLEFTDLNYLLAANKEARLTFKIDLSESIKIGTRLRLDLENPEDLKLKINEERFTIQNNFPVKGKYMSISRSRFKK